MSNYADLARFGVSLLRSDRVSVPGSAARALLSLDLFLEQVADGRLVVQHAEIGVESPREDTQTEGSDNEQ